MNLKKGDYIRYVTQRGDGSGLAKEIGIKVQIVEVVAIAPNKFPGHISGLTPKDADFIGRLENKELRQLTYQGVLKNLSSAECLLSIKYKC